MIPADLPHVWLTTVRQDGSPHTTPLWFVLADEILWLASPRASIKVRNILHDPRTSMAFEQTAAEPWVAEGTAVVHERPEDHPDQVVAFATKYDGWDVTSPVRDGHRVLVEVQINRWLLRP